MYNSILMLKKRDFVFSTISSDNSIPYLQLSFNDLRLTMVVNKSINIKFKYRSKSFKLVRLHHEKNIGLVWANKLLRITNKFGIFKYDYVQLVI